jgi:glutamyl-tRNA reductase
MACGLLSKVKGETEVMGQFKKFISILHKQDSWLKYAFNFEKLLAEVKRCRSGFLTDLGSQSYGSVVRKWIPEGAEVSLVGAGLLAKDIEPWLKNRNVTVFSRSPAKAKTISSVKDLNLLQRAEFLVIAAPLENHSIQSLIAKSHCRHMIDLRALTQEQEAEVKSFCSQRNLQIFTLTDLFSLIDSDRPEILKKVQMAEEALKKFVESLDAHLMIRPLGWEDVCA